MSKQEPDILIISELWMENYIVLNRDKYTSLFWLEKNFVEPSTYPLSSYLLLRSGLLHVFMSHFKGKWDMIEEIVMQSLEDLNSGKAAGSQTLMALLTLGERLSFFAGCWCLLIDLYFSCPGLQYCNSWTLQCIKKMIYTLCTLLLLLPPFFVLWDSLQICLLQFLVIRTGWKVTELFHLTRFCSVWLLPEFLCLHCFSFTRFASSPLQLFSG